ncbi:MAG: uroporphyrinogen decarboxylase family protein [Spirochaetaceae bacterium]
MTSKERVLRAFKRGEGLPDRVPFQFDLCKQLIDHFSEKLDTDPGYAWSYYEDLSYRISANELRTSLGSDVVVVGGEVARDFTPEKVGDNVTTNEFGMHMKPTELYVEVVKPPLEGVESVEEVEAYKMPDPYAPGRFEMAKKDIERFGKDKFLIGDVEITIFEFAWHLTGMEEYLVGLMTEEEWVERLNDKVEAWSMGLAEQLVDLGVDAIWFGEDLGTQTSMLMSPEMWRERFRPRYERMIGALKRRNPELILIMHSDGAVAPMVDDWIEMGIDVYNPVQPNVPGSDPKELKEKYGDRISFFGGIDQQQLLPSGDEAAIRDEMKRRAEILGEGGGYLMAPAHIIQADVAPKTVEIMCDQAVKG